MKKWSEENKEKRKEYREKYYLENYNKLQSYWKSQEVLEKKRIRKREKYALLKETNPEFIKAKTRRDNLKRDFNLTEEAFNHLFRTQGSRCAICGSKTSGTKRNFHVDHDHTTGKIRGILCHNCNLLLGHAKDNIEILSKSIEYLKLHTEIVKTPKVEEL